MLNVPAMNVAMQTVFFQSASGQTVAIVMDPGESVSHAPPFCNMSAFVAVVMAGDGVAPTVLQKILRTPTPKNKDEIQIAKVLRDLELIRTWTRVKHSPVDATVDGRCHVSSV